MKNFWAPVTALCLVNTYLYFNTIRLFFWADDFIMLKLVKQLSLLDYVKAGLSGYLANDPVIQYLYIGSVFRPVTHYFYWKLGWELFSLNPLGYHAVNLFVHLINTLLVFWLALLLSRSKLASFLAAFFYACAVYIHVEPMTRLFVINESLCVLFLLISFITYVQATQVSPQKRKVFWLLIGTSVASFGIGLLSDERAIVFPAVILLYDLLFNDSPAFSMNAFMKRATQWAPYWILSLIYLLIRLPGIIPAITGSGGRYEFTLRPDIPMRYFYGFKWIFLEFLRPLERFVKKQAPQVEFDLVVFWIIISICLVGLIFSLWKYKRELAKNLSFRLIIFGIGIFILFPAPIMLANIFQTQYFTAGAIGLCLVAGYLVAMALEKVKDYRIRFLLLGLLLFFSVQKASQIEKFIINSPKEIPQRSLESKYLLGFLKSEQIDVSNYDAILLTGFPTKLFANSRFIIESAAFELFLDHPAIVYQNEEIEPQPDQCMQVLVINHQDGNSVEEKTIPSGCKK